MIKKKLNNIPLGVKASFVYVISSVMTRGLVMLTMPIFTRIMTTAQIGTVNEYNSWYSLLVVIVNLSLTSGGFQAAMKDYENERDQYVSSITFLTVLSAAVCGLVYFTAPRFWNHYIGLSTELMVLMLCTFAMLPAKEFWLLRQRYEYKYKLAGGLTIVTSVLGTIAAIAVVVIIKDTAPDKVVEGRLYATNIVSIIISLIIMISIFLKGKTFYNKEYWKYSLSLSIPLIGYAFANQVLNTSDRIMIGMLVDESAVGIYGTLFNVSTIPTIVWSAINSSFIPFLFQNIEKKNNNIKKYSLALLGAYAIIAVVITYMAPEIVKILATEEYYEAIPIMPPIAAGIFLMSVSNMYSNVLVYHKSTKYIMYSAVIAAITNVVMNYFFITEYGYMAAAYTTLVAHLILVGVQFVFAKRVHQQKTGEKEVYDDKSVIGLMIITIVVALLGLPLYQNIWLRYIIIVIGMCAGGTLAISTIKRMKRK